MEGIKSVIFSKDARRNTSVSALTNDCFQVERSGTFTLWDCESEDHFIDHFLGLRECQEEIFSNVKVFIYVFTAQNERQAQINHNESTASKQAEMLRIEVDHFQKCITALRQFSPAASVFCLLHKMELILETHRSAVVQRYEALLKDVVSEFAWHCLGTSLWNGSLFMAWSRVVQTLLRNGDKLQNQLELLREACSADEVVLFDRSTLLKISGAAARNVMDAHRHEKLAMILKNFQLSGRMMNTTVKHMCITTADFTLILHHVMTRTFVMVLLLEQSSPVSSVLLNIKSFHIHTSAMMEKVDLACSCESLPMWEVPMCDSH